MIRTRSSLGEDGRRERGYERKDRQLLGRQRTAPLSHRPRVTVQRPGCEYILSLGSARRFRLLYGSASAAFPPFSPRARESWPQALSLSSKVEAAPPKRKKPKFLCADLYAFSARATLGDGRNQPIASTRRAASRAGLLPSVCSHRIGCGRPIDEW